MPIRSTSPVTTMAPTPQRDNLMPEVAPSWSETFAAGFRMENSIVNAHELMTRPTFKPTKDYKLGARLKELGYWEDRDEFLGVQSDEEFQWTAARLARERHARNTLARAGWGGVAAGLTAGIISPINFIPILGPAARAGQAGKAALQGAGLTGVAVAGEEAILYANQQERTALEVGLGVGAGAVLGGLIGGAAGLLRKGEFDRMASDMADPPRDATVSTTIPWSNESSAGSRQVKAADAGGFKAGKLMSPFVGIAALTRNIAQTRSGQLRYMASQFGDAGLRRTGASKGIAAAEGGTIENNIKTYATKVQEFTVRAREGYTKYLTNDNAPKLFPNLRAGIQGHFAKDKLSRKEFYEEVTKATWANDTHAIAEVAELAKHIRENVYNPLFAEAKELGIYGKDVELQDVLGDPSYGMRIWDTDVISSQHERFVQKLTDHIRKKLEDDFAKRLEKLKKSTKREEQLIEDITRPQEEIVALRRHFVEELEELDRQLPPDLKMIEDDIKLLQREKFGIPRDQLSLRQKLTDEINLLKERGGPQLKETRAKKLAVRRRINNLNQSRVVLEEKYAKKLDKIERNEELQVETLLRAAKQAQNLLALVGKGTDKQVAAELSKFKTAFAKTAKTFDTAEEQITKARADKDESLGKVLEGQEARADRLDELAERIENVEAFDKAALIREVDDAAKELLETHAKINARRAVRAGRLQEQAKKMEPAAIDARLKALREKIPERKAEFMEYFRARGLDDFDDVTEKADFKEYAREIAQNTTTKIMGTERRIVLNDIIQETRGPEKARLLDVSSLDFQDYIVKDADRIVSTYVRTLAADISLARKFGSADAKRAFDDLLKEEQDALARVPGAKDKKGNPLSEDAQKALSQDITKFYAEGRHDMHVLMERAKGIRGVPKDPRGWAARGFSTARDLNTLRYMGGVLLASVADPARIVQKYGLTKVFKQAYTAFTGGLKEVKLSMGQAQRAGTGLDVDLHSRAHAAYDVFDDVQHGTKLEKGIHWGTQKIGLFALFDYWTVAGKSFASGLENTTIIDALEKVMTGKGSAKEIQKATEELAARNIVGRDAEVIWEQLNAKGGGRVNGVLLPETEKWDISRAEVKQALRTYNSALVGTIDDTIVTPGFERPNWVDANEAGKLIGQFRSFGLSSTTKTLMAGLQAHDAAYFQGIMVSLALGTVSYYLWAVASGGKAYEDMMNADIGRWADEAIARSGQMAIFDEMQRIAQRLPMTAEYSSFSGERTSRRQGGDLIDVLLGPTFDLLRKGATVAAGIDDPTRATGHAARQMLPYQNVFFIRWVFDRIEEFADLPEERKPKK